MCGGLNDVCGLASSPSGHTVKSFANRGTDGMGIREANSLRTHRFFLESDPFVLPREWGQIEGAGERTVSRLLTSQPTRPLRSICRVSLAGNVPWERGDRPSRHWRTQDDGAI